MFTLDALRDAIAPRLAAARVKTDPFPHVWVDDIWPADVYARLEAAWPGDHLFYADKKGRKWNLAATAVPPSQKRGDFAAVPADHQALWCSRLSTFMPTTFLSVRRGEWPFGRIDLWLLPTVSMRPTASWLQPMRRGARCCSFTWLSRTAPRSSRNTDRVRVGS